MAPSVLSKAPPGSKAAANMSGDASRGAKKGLESNSKYKLRRTCLGRSKGQAEAKAAPKKRGPKPRPKTQLMSKYRRKAANQRERERMGEINIAFEHLKAKIPTPLTDPPSPPTGPGAGKPEAKMTKINILHIAINYIRALENILETGEAGVQVYGTSVICGSSSWKGSPGSAGSIPGQDDYSPQEDSTGAALTSTILRKKSPVDKRPPALGSPFKGPAKGKPPVSGSSQKDPPKQLQPSGLLELGHEPFDLYDDIYCPDWTELTSTLEFPALGSNPTGGPEQSGAASPAASKGFNVASGPLTFTTTHGTTTISPVEPVKGPRQDPQPAEAKPPPLKVPDLKEVGPVKPRVGPRGLKVDCCLKDRPTGSFAPGSLLETPSPPPLILLASQLSFPADAMDLDPETWLQEEMTCAKGKDGFDPGALTLRSSVSSTKSSSVSPFHYSSLSNSNSQSSASPASSSSSEDYLFGFQPEDHPFHIIL